jgi:hypothetical protein
MDTLVIDRGTLPETLRPIIGASRIRVEYEADRMVLTPAADEADEYDIDPNDYDNDTDYLCAIPGMVEKIVEGRNTPLSECEDVPEDWFDENVCGEPTINNIRRKRHARSR